MNYKILFLFLTFVPELCFSEFSFELGEKFRVLGDRGIRDSVQKLFEVQGNVVIINGPLTMYGGHSILDFKNKKITAKENIRLSSSEFTIFADNLNIDLEKQLFNLKYARYESGQRLLFGENILKKPDGDIDIRKGKYTTCLGCNKGWYIYGDEIQITPNKYVRMKDAYFFIRNVPVFYFPYLIFPIKKERETGILFPRVSYNSGDGFYFQLPIFLAPSSSYDLTFSPGIFGDFGLGIESEFRMRQNSNDFLDVKHYWLEKDRFNLDRKNPEVFIIDYRKQFSKNLVFYFNGIFLDDLDLYRSFNRFLIDDILTEDIGGDAFLEFQGQSFGVSAFYSHRNNLLDEKSEEFDQSYLQIQPEIQFSINPIIFNNWFSLFPEGLHNNFYTEYLMQNFGF